MLLVLVLVAVCSLLTLDVLVTGQLSSGEGRPSGSRQYVPEQAVSGGSLVDPREPTVQHPPDRTVALTFVDGPDPERTPALLDMLARHHVRATFFATGANAAEHPDLIRQIVAAGHENRESHHDPRRPAPGR